MENMAEVVRAQGLFWDRFADVNSDFSIFLVGTADVKGDLSNVFLGFSEGFASF